MPVKHDSPEWQGMISDVAALKKDVSAINHRITDLAKQQDERHEENIDRMSAIEKNVEEIHRVMARVEGAFDGAKQIGKLIAWLLGLVIAFQTISTFFGPLIRSHMGLPNSKNSEHPTTLSESQHEQFNADLPKVESHPSKE